MALAWSIGSPAPLLETRPLNLPLFVIVDTPLVNFDLLDVRSEAPLSVVKETEPHTVFALRRHVGIAGGYDQGVVHGSVGLYITVAELGRWNLGIPSPGIGLSRYHLFDRSRGTYATTIMSLLISLASVHYRAGYLQSIHKHWYVNFEQVFDSRSNLSGSQVGISLSQ